MNAQKTFQELFDQSLLTVDFSARSEHNAWVKARWKEFVRRQNPTATHMLMRNLLLGHPINRGFSPITNPLCLANGHRPWLALENAIDLARFCPIGALSPWIELSLDDVTPPQPVAVASHSSPGLVGRLLGRGVPPSSTPQRKPAEKEIWSLLPNRDQWLEKLKVAR